MTTAETFEWLRQRSELLEETLAENRKLKQAIADLTLKIAWLQTSTVREEEVKGEDITTDVLNFPLK